MSYDILSIPPFDKQLKRLARKYPSLKSDFSALLDSLQTEPEQGTAIGKSCYKIRLAVKSKGRGKSGGSRVITNIVIAETTVYLLAIYDKSDKETLSDKELDDLLRLVPE